MLVLGMATQTLGHQHPALPFVVDQLSFGPGSMFRDFSHWHVRHFDLSIFINSLRATGLSYCSIPRPS